MKKTLKKAVKLIVSKWWYITHNACKLLDLTCYRTFFKKTCKFKHKTSGNVLITFSQSSPQTKCNYIWKIKLFAVI